ncbi:hypothetical protein [Pseudomonas sp. FG-3G]|nr:hypothetical protein [Pseudomonas sp. FG-3G]
MQRAYTRQRPSHTAQAHKNAEKVAISLGREPFKRARPMPVAHDRPVITDRSFIGWGKARFARAAAAP